MKEFHTPEEAIADMLANLDEECVDAERFTFLDDEAGCIIYAETEADGCCGFQDEEILVAGRPAKVGCCYGH